MCEKRKIYGFGQGADMSRFAPHAHLTAIEDIWGPYYISRAKAMLDNSWKPDNTWWGMKEGTVVISPYNPAVPANARAAADKIIAGWKDGSYDVFTGPISDQSGKERVAKGERMKDGDILVMDWYVQGRAELISLSHPTPGNFSRSRRGSAPLPLREGFG